MKAMSGELLCELPEDWEDLDCSAQDALLKWYNVQEEYLNTKDLQRLADLFKAGQFEFGECAKCGEEYRKGTPDDWGKFQGVSEVDHVGLVCDECYSDAADVIEMSGVGWIGS